MEFHGRVIQEHLAEGSKSERSAICLSTRHKNYVLRRRGGPPVTDPVLEELVGQVVTIEGHVVGNTIIVTAWRPD